jgi:hypothetical protein
MKPHIRYVEGTWRLYATRKSRFAVAIGFSLKQTWAQYLNKLAQDIIRKEKKRAEKYSITRGFRSL